MYMLPCRPDAAVRLAPGQIPLHFSLSAQASPACCGCTCQSQTNSQMMHSFHTHKLTSCVPAAWDRPCPLIATDAALPGCRCNPCCLAGQMLLFGWRLVFALSIISAGLAFVLRLHMPEPEEFTDEREEIIFQNLQRIAASRPASISVRRSSMSAIPSSSARYNGNDIGNNMLNNSGGGAGGLAAYPAGEGCGRYLGLRAVCSLQLSREQVQKRSRSSSSRRKACCAIKTAC